MRPSRALLVLLAALGAGLAWSGLLRFPGLHDNDFPLLMWLAHAASPGDPTPLAIGHYPPVQLVLVRLLGPLAGSTLVAAKLLNVLATVACAWLVARIAARISAVPWAGVVAAFAFAASAEAMVTGQSEFGDPLALACWLGGVAVGLDAAGARAFIAAGALLGLAGAIRLHFESFGFATALVLLALHRSRAALALLAGLPIGLAPSWGVNVAAHGSPFSPVAHTFVGQVLFGFDVDDLAGSYARHPLREVLAHHKLLLLSLVARRLAALVERWPALLGIAALASLPRRGPPASRHRLLAVWLLLLGYAVAVVGPSWTPTHRLLMPALAMLAILVAASVAIAVPERFRVHALAALAFLFVVLVPGERWGALRVLRERDGVWRQSQAVTAVLRRHGIREPREAFAVDWNRVLTDDPRLVALYNFGFWNSLHAGFRAERPSPFPLAHDPARFAGFLRERGVRAVVLSRSYPRFAELRAIANGGELPGFARAATLDDDAVFVAQR